MHIKWKITIFYIVLWIKISVSLLQDVQVRSEQIVMLNQSVPLITSRV